MCSRSVFFRRRERSEIETEENSREFFFGAVSRQIFFCFSVVLRETHESPGEGWKRSRGCEVRRRSVGEDSAAGGGGGAGGLFLVMSCVGVAGLE